MESSPPPLCSISSRLVPSTNTEIIWWSTPSLIICRCPVYNIHFLRRPRSLPPSSADLAAAEHSTPGEPDFLSSPALLPGYVRPLVSSHSDVLRSMEEVRPVREEETHYVSNNMEISTPSSMRTVSCAGSQDDQGIHWVISPSRLTRSGTRAEKVPSRLDHHHTLWSSTLPRRRLIAGRVQG